MYTFKSLWYVLLSVGIRSGIYTKIKIKKWNVKVLVVLFDSNLLMWEKSQQQGVKCKNM